MRIGFIGTGVMGASMAGHLLEAEHELHLYTRTRAKAEDLLGRGAVWANGPEDLTRCCEVIFTMVGFPSDVESIYFNPRGLLATMRPGTLLVDLTTSSPKLARRIAQTATGRGGMALDAPVSGGDKGAREATLSIMVGGEKEAFNAALPLLKIMGKGIVLQGPAGSGQHCKMCNQIAIASNMLGVCEALAYARRAGLDARTVLSSISGGAAGSWSLNNLAPRILEDNFAPGFYVKHFIKDMRIAIESAGEMNLELPGLALALRLYKQLAQQGHANRGTQALALWYFNKLEA